MCALKKTACLSVSSRVCVLFGQQEPKLEGKDSALFASVLRKALGFARASAAKRLRSSVASTRRLRGRLNGPR